MVDPTKLSPSLWPFKNIEFPIISPLALILPPTVILPVVLIAGILIDDVKGKEEPEIVSTRITPDDLISPPTSNVYDTVLLLIPTLLSCILKFGCPALPPPSLSFNVLPEVILKSPSCESIPTA